MTDAKRSYMLSSLPYHLSHSGNHARLSQILRSMKFIRAKIEEIDIEAIAHDYDFIDLPVFKLIQEALRLSASTLQLVKSELWMSHVWSQLFCRLMIHIERYPELKMLFLGEELPPWSIYTLTPSMSQAGGVIKRTILDLKLAHAINALGFTSPTTLLSVSDDGIARIINLETYQMTEEFFFVECESGSPLVMADDKLITLSESGSIEIFDPSAGELLEEINFHEPITTFCVCEDTLFFGSRIGQVIKSDLTSPDKLKTLSRYWGETVVGLGLASNGYLASVSDVGTVFLIDISSGEVSKKIALQCNTRCCAIGNGEILIGGVVGTNKLLELESGNVHDFVVPRKSEFDERFDTCSVAFLADGRYITGATDGTIRIWEKGHVLPVVEVKEHHKTIRSILVLPDRRFISGSGDGSIKLWDIPKDAVHLKELPLNSGMLVMYPDGSSHVWQIDEETVLYALQLHMTTWYSRQYVEIDEKHFMNVDGGVLNLFVRVNQQGAARIARFFADQPLVVCGVAPSGIIVAFDIVNKFHFLKFQDPEINH